MHTTLPLGEKQQQLELGWSEIYLATVDSDPMRGAVDSEWSHLLDIPSLLTTGFHAPENRRNPLYKVYIQPVGSGTPVPMPTTGAEQMVTPTFLP